METSVTSNLQSRSNPAGCSDKKVLVAFLHKIRFFFPLSSCVACFLLTVKHVKLAPVANSAADWIKLQFSKLPGKEKNITGI